MEEITDCVIDIFCVIIEILWILAEIKILLFADQKNKILQYKGLFVLIWRNLCEDEVFEGGQEDYNFATKSGHAIYNGCERSC